MGVSENSVPLNPMVLLIIIPIKTQWLMIIIPMKNGYFIGNINPTFSDKPKKISHDVPLNHSKIHHVITINPIKLP